MALRILPNIRAFQHPSKRSHDNRPIADFNLIDKRLSNAGLLIYNGMTCTSDDIICLYEDLLLVAGSVRNQITKCVYEAPIFIKRSLSKQALKLLEGRSITKILVLPRTITTVNRNNFFTDSSLISNILDNEMKRDFNRRSSDCKRFATSPMEISEHIKCNKNRTCVVNKIDEQNHQITTNIDRSLFVTSNKLSNTSSNKSSTAEYHEPITLTTADQQKKRRSIPKFDKPTVAIHSIEKNMLYKTIENE